jgi:hypothetical protein
MSAVSFKLARVVRGNLGHVLMRSYIRAEEIP